MSFATKGKLGGDFRLLSGISFTPNKGLLLLVLSTHSACLLHAGHRPCVSVSDCWREHWLRYTCERFLLETSEHRTRNGKAYSKIITTIMTLIL